MRIFLLFAIFVVCFADDEPTAVQRSAAAVANSRFGIELLQKLSNSSENVFFSPFSIWTALAMTSLGAAGNTLKQVESSLHFDSVNINDPMATYKVCKANIELYNQPNSNYSLSTANRLYGKEGFEIKETFQENVKKYFHAELQQVNFDGSAEEIINHWVAEQTRDKIKTLFPPNSLSSDTVLVLVNAIYFKGNWNSQFKKSETQDGTFHSIDNSESTVPMMRQKNKFGYIYDSNLKVQVLELPYVGNELAMYIFLPDAVDGLRQFIQQLTVEKCEELIGNLRETQVDVKLPKFKLETEYSLKDTLRSLGIEDLFSDSANLSSITDDEIYVDKVVHAAMVRVNERGAEAAASTGVGFIYKSMRQPVIEEFYADKPFLFIIRNKESESDLFVGTLVKRGRGSAALRNARKRRER